MSRESGEMAVIREVRVVHPETKRVYDDVMFSVSEPPRGRYSILTDSSLRVMWHEPYGYADIEPPWVMQVRDSNDGDWRTVDMAMEKEPRTPWNPPLT